MTDRTQLVLASSSASRALVLRNAGAQFLQVAPQVDEEKIFAGRYDDPEVMGQVTQAKLGNVLQRSAEDLGLPPGTKVVVVAADSMLLINGKLQGKPGSTAGVIAAWEKQAGLTGELLTYHCFAVGEVTSQQILVSQQLPQLVRSAVVFGTPTAAQIAAYAATGEPQGCAGAFTLEAHGGWFIEKINGCMTNVLGLSLPALRQACSLFAVDLLDLWAATAAVD